MWRNTLIVIWAPLVGVWALAQPRPLTNEDILAMVKSGLSDETIVEVIKAQPAVFDGSPQALITLKGAGVSEVIIAAMLRASNGESPGESFDEGDRPILQSGPRGERAEQKLPAIYVEEVSSEGSVTASSDTTLEAIKTLQKKGMRILTIRDKADFILQVTRQLGKKSWRKDTKIVLSNREGEVVYTNSTRSVGGAMGDVVDYIKKNHM